MRNKLTLLCALTIIAFLFSGCVIWDAGYTENKAVKALPVNDLDKVSVTFSVSLEMDRKLAFAYPTEKGLRERIEKAFAQTGIFSEVRYVPLSKKSDYHVHFSFYQAGMKEEEAVGWALLCGYSLLTIPMVEILTLDGTAVVTLRDDSLFSTVKAEEIRDVTWLPLLPFGFFLNAWTGWSAVERGIVNALVNDVARFHNEKFIQQK